MNGRVVDSGTGQTSSADLRGVIVGTLSELRGVFVTSTRADGSEYVHLSDDYWGILRDVVRDAHGDHMPNDLVWELCADVWGWIVEHCDYLLGDGAADVLEALNGDSLAFMCADYLVESFHWCWYSDQARWFGGDPDARDWCETYRRDYLGGESVSVDRLMAGGLFVRLRAIAWELGQCLAGIIEDRAETAGVEL